MPVDYGFKIFGDAGDSGTDVAIPKTFGSSKSPLLFPYPHPTPQYHIINKHSRCIVYGTTCGVTLSATSSLRIRRDQAVNWDIWAAAVKVNAICARRGLGGVATGIGTFSLSLREGGR